MWTFKVWLPYYSYPIYPILYKVGIVCIFVLHKSRNKFDTVISRINFNSMHYDKFGFVLNLVQLLPIFTARHEVGEGNIFSSVSQEFCTQGRGVFPIACWDTTPPPCEQTPSGADLGPPRSDPPSWEQTHPSAVHAGRYGQQAGGTHPTGM